MLLPAITIPEVICSVFPEHLKPKWDTEMYLEVLGFLLVGLFCFYTAVVFCLDECLAALGAVHLLYVAGVTA